MEILVAVIIIIVFVAIQYLRHKAFEFSRQQRRDEYNKYLKTDAWQRKRYVVLKRDNWRCVYCGDKAIEVHHKRYAKWNIGREPIHWLVSVCKKCHQQQHKL